METGGTLGAVGVAVVADVVDHKASWNLSLGCLVGEAVNLSRDATPSDPCGVTSRGDPAAPVPATVGLLC